MMIDLDPKDAHYLEGRDFVALARTILKLRGTDNLSNNWLEIRSNYNGLDLQITRQKQIVEEGHRNSHLRVSNPTTMVKNGEVIRHHDEHAYLTQQMIDMLQQPQVGTPEWTEWALRLELHPYVVSFCSSFAIRHSDMGLVPWPVVSAMLYDERDPSKFIESMASARLAASFKEFCDTTQRIEADDPDDRILQMVKEVKRIFEESRGTFRDV